MLSDCIYTQYGLGLTPTTVIPLARMGIAMPDQVVHRPAASYYVRMDFSRVGDGYSSIEWIWDIISIGRLSTLLSFLAGATYKSLYVVSDVRDGTYPNPKPAFKMYYATMWKPILSGEEGVSSARSAIAMQTVKVQFVNVQEQAGYL